MGTAPRICFITLGCPKNEVDSDRMAALVAASAYTLTDDPGSADVVVLNTCSFIQAATEESIAAAFELANDWRPQSPDRRLVIAGCMPSRYGAALADAMPEADAFVPVAEESAILSVLSRLTATEAAAHPVRIARTGTSVTAYLKVSEGCDRRCAYCTIPAIRGPFVSVPAVQIVAEARFLIERGARELVLVGQDVANWGRDLTPKGDLASLVAQVASLDGDHRVRLMYVQPDGVTDALLESIATHERVCHYLDVPLQHASATVLRAMGRTGDATRHLELVARIRAALPDVTLRTTLIAGFPGETAADVDLLEDFVESARFDYTGVFAYSPEEGTRAASAPHQVRPATRRARAQRIRDVADRVGFQRAASRVGEVVRVLVEGVDEAGETVGRTCGQAPDVDGVTILEGPAETGTFVTCRIHDAVGYDLVGEVL